MTRLITFVTLIFALTLIPLTVFGQHTLTIEIGELLNSTGQIVLELSNEKGERITGITKKIEKKKCIMSISNLTSGKYAFKYFHDENKNMVLDLNWMGIPHEGFGFSTNPKVVLGAPSLEETIFELKGSITLKCTTSYYRI